MWETKLADRAYQGSGCPYHMSLRVHPTESLAAGSSRSGTRPRTTPTDQVTRASARDIAWRCEAGHTWTAAVYQRTLSQSGRPPCPGSRVLDTFGRE